jgi:hypothetical protein
LGSEYNGNAIHSVDHSDDAGMYVFSINDSDVLFAYGTQNLLDGMRLLGIERVDLGGEVIRCDKPKRSPLTFFLPIVYNGKVAGTLGIWWMRLSELEAVLT